MSLLTYVNYRKLKNTVMVLRMSGAPLTPEQEIKVKKFERAVARYEQQHSHGVDYKSRAAGEREE